MDQSAHNKQLQFHNTLSHSITRVLSSDIEPDPGCQTINHHLEDFIVAGAMIIVPSKQFA